MRLTEAPLRGGSLLHELALTGTQGCQRDYRWPAVPAAKSKGTGSGGADQGLVSRDRGRS